MKTDEIDENPFVFYLYIKQEEPQDAGDVAQDAEDTTDKDNIIPNYPCDVQITYPPLAYKCSYITGDKPFGDNYRFWDVIVIAPDPNPKKQRDA